MPSSPLLSNLPPSAQEIECDDDFYSLFYSPSSSSSFPVGSGHPLTHTCDDATMRRLTTVHPEYRRLPLELYEQCVANLVIVCVDVILQRKSDRKLLLFLRRDPPAKGIWWWPGGRMFRGETFQQAAVRKICEETGFNDTKKFKVKGLVGVWNTFFHDSCFDKNRPAGKEGTQTVNVTIVIDFEGDDYALEPSTPRSREASSDYAVERHRWVSVSEALSQGGTLDKYVRLNVEKGIAMGLLL